MTELSLSGAEPVDARVDALLVGLYQGDDGPVAADPASPRRPTPSAGPARPAKSAR